MDNSFFGLLGDDEVVFVRAGRVLMANPTFKVSEFLDALAQLVSEREAEWFEDQEGWFTDQGTSCEVLRFGNQGWQRGRIRIRLEFCPERPPKLLRESRTPREDAYTDTPYRLEDSSRSRESRRNNREDVYGRDSYGREDIYRGGDRPSYPDLDEDY